MPLPGPKNDEDYDDWMERCLADDLMNKEYPDNKQRFAICQNIWNEKEEEDMNINNELRGAIGIHHTPLSDKAWDGPTNIARLRNDETAPYYKKMFAWVDPDGDPDVKSSYKFPHHEVSSDGTIGAANIKSCQSSIAVLNGSRGGADIPDSDRKGVYNHVAAHLRDGDIEPAELKSDNPKEIRSYNFELRANRETPEIVGYSAVFDELSEDLGGFREKVRKGAFSETIKGDDVRALFNHDPNYVLGRTTNETLFLEEDDRGLKIKIIPPDTQWARDLLFSVARGDISQMSFAFETLVDEWNEEEVIPIRTLVKTKLYDVSIVTYPAYPQTNVGIRSPEDIYRTHITERQKISNEEKLSEEKLRQKIRQSYYKMRINLFR